MPELPEVETVRRGLLGTLDGHRLVRVTARRPDLRRPFPEGFAERLRDRTVISIGRRAKYLLLALDNGWVLLAHLGMSGRMLIGPADDTPFGAHDHVILDTEAGRRVIFNDARRFGLMDLVKAEDLSRHPLLRDLGPEPLDKSFTGKVLAKTLAGKRCAIKAALLDQRVVAGIGNIYASESLFLAGIAPMRDAGDVTWAEAKALVRAVKTVLERAIAAGGSSLRDHRQPSGELGYFQHSFAVYGRDGEPCPECAGEGGISRIVQSGRATYYCRYCQR